jgi:8-oxo-dGTP pyrophosphatase MutT (NUDIX family)
MGLTSLETAIHETHEELGLTIPTESFQKLATITQYEKRFDGLISKQFVDVYLVVHDFTEADVRLQTRDVQGGKLIDSREFQTLLKNKGIDFVDHAEEIAVVMSEVQKRFGEK